MRELVEALSGQRQGTRRGVVVVAVFGACWGYSRYFLLGNVVTAIWTISVVN